jgi:hypothetical protein
MISRIALTLSGYLHIGSALNFMITLLQVKWVSGRLLLARAQAYVCECARLSLK